MSNLLFPNQASQKVSPIWVTEHGAADEGNFFIANNPTVGTPIATTTSVVDDAATASATHAQCYPVALLQNNWGATDPSQRVVYLKYLRMLISQVPSSAVTWNFAMRLDKNPSRLTTAASVITPVNCNSNSNNASRLVVNFGALVCVAPTASARLTSHGVVNSAVPVIYDQWLFVFGSPSMPSAMLSGGNAAKFTNIPCGPICIAPEWSLSLEMWGASNAAAPSWEFELGFVERPQGQ